MEIFITLLVIIGVIGIVAYPIMSSNEYEVKERNANRKAKLQGVFSEISIGMGYSEKCLSA